MLTTLFEYLFGKLCTLGWPVYNADCVPHHAGFPYITMRISPPTAITGTGEMILTCWCSEDSPHAQRLSMADQVLGMIPSGGLRIPMDSGLAMIYRRTDDCAEFLESHGTLGARLRFDLRILSTR